MLQLLLRTLFILDVVAALAAWAAIVVFGFKALRSIRADVPRPRGWIGLNPANVVVFCPDRLTADGLRYRRRLGWSAVMFVVLTSVGLLMGAAGFAV